MTCLLLHLVSHDTDYSHTVLEWQTFHGRFYVNFWPLKNCGQEGESTWFLSLAEAMNNLFKWFTVRSQRRDMRLSFRACICTACLPVGSCWYRLIKVRMRRRHIFVLVKSGEQPCMMLAIWRYEWLHGTVAVHSSSCPSSRKVGRNSCRGQRRAEILSFVNIYDCCQKLPL